MTAIEQFPQRQATYRFTLTDTDGNDIGVLTVNRDKPPTMNVDVSRPMKRTLTGVELPPSVVNDVDLIANRVRIEMDLGGELHPLGLYLFTSPTETVLSGPIVHTSFIDVASFVTLSLVDQLMIVDQLTTKATTLRPGASVTDFIVSFLTSMGVDADIEESSAIVGREALVWPPATSGLRIINELATMLGYHELYFGNDSRGKLGPFPDPDVVPGEETVDHTNRVFRPSVTRENNLLELPNRFIVVGSGATSSPVVGYYDIPDDAPHSIANRGFPVAYSEQAQGIADSSQARAAAQALARRRQFALETLNFSTAFDPRHDHYTIVELEGQRFLEVGWSAPLTEKSAMRHVVRRTYEASDG